MNLSIKARTAQDMRQADTLEIVDVFMNENARIARTNFILAVRYGQYEAAAGRQVATHIGQELLQINNVLQNGTADDEVVRALCAG